MLKMADQIIIERVFDSSVEAVWKAWTDAEMIKQWWDPKDFTAPSIKIDFKVGGQYIYCMKGPKGTQLSRLRYIGNTSKLE